MTALSATFQPATAISPPAVLVEVTAAPFRIPKYVSNYTASVDGWTGSTGTALAFNQGVDEALRLTSNTAGGGSTFTRTVTGLTIGVTYKFATMVRGDAGNYSLSVVGLGGSTSAQFSRTRVALSFTFVATATSHQIRVTVNPGKPIGSTVVPGVVYLDTTTVVEAGTWLGTTITRTDANGTAVPVRTTPGQETDAAGTMTVTDYEAALVGPVVYRVVDGLGAVAANAVTVLRRNVMPNPSGENNATGWVAVGAGVVVSSAALGTSPSGTRIVRAALGTAGSSGAQQDAPAVAGQRYALRVSVRTPDVTDTVTVRLQFLDAGNALLQSTGSTPTANPNTGGFYTHTVEATAPANTVTVRMMVLRSPGNVTTGHRLFIDAALVEPLAVGATFDTTYFDGDSPGGYWTGATRASESQLAGGPAIEAPPTLHLPVTALPALGGPPAFVLLELITGWSEEAPYNGVVHQVIGRADPIANPGVLGYRRGSARLWCSTYAVAAKVVELLSRGEVAMIRQPTHAGMDAYMVPTGGARIDPLQDTATQRWGVDVGFTEVAAP